MSDGRYAMLFKRPRRDFLCIDNVVPGVHVHGVLVVLLTIIEELLVIEIVAVRTEAHITERLLFGVRTDLHAVFESVDENVHKSTCKCILNEMQLLLMAGNDLCLFSKKIAHTFVQVDSDFVWLVFQQHLLRGDCLGGCGVFHGGAFHGDVC